MTLELDTALMGTYAPAPVTFVSGDGVRLFDAAGRSYLDFLSGIAVVSLGHCNPAVTEAVREQAGRLWHVSNLFHNELAAPLASEIDDLIGEGKGPAGRVFFCNSGAEANECAFKLVRKASPQGRYVVVSALNSFHGRTLATLHATGQPAKHEPFQPLPAGFTHVPYGDVGALREAVSPEVAGVILEGVQGEGGVIPAPPGYLRAVRELCDERGLLLVLDEIQTGLGRTGRWFSFQHDDVLPDVVTLAKALGNGFPIGACWAREEVASAFAAGDHGSTFGGQPLACSAALATIRELRRLDAPARAVEAGERLAGGLAGLQGVLCVRGRGLLLGAVLDPGGRHAGASRELAAAALEAGLVLNAPSADVLRLAPPLVVSNDEVDTALCILGDVLA